MNMADVIGVWISAILTIAITTLAWKDQPVSKVAEHIYVGVVTGNTIVYAWRNINEMGLAKIKGGTLIYIIPILLGLMAYARYSRKYFWIYRYSISFIVGTGLGTSMRGLIGGSFLDQIKDSFYQLVVPGDPVASFNGIVMFVVLLSCLIYFIFTIKTVEMPTVTTISKLGRYSLMAAFGYSFANTIATRINQYAGRINFLVLEWLKLGG